MVGNTLVMLAVWLPLLLAVAFAVPRLRRTQCLITALPLAALPLLLAAFTGGDVALDPLLLGMRLGVDTAHVPLLAAAGLIWTAAGWHAAMQFRGDPAAWRYGLFHLLTLAGNAGVLLTQNLVGLYFWYALMTLAAYGLVVHDRKPESLRAGRVYIVVALIAEALLLMVVLTIGAVGGNAALDALPALLAGHPSGFLLAVLVFAGFAVKMGVMPLHVWLPLAHPRAPVPASAVLSGVIVKAGLIGWLRLLPLGSDGFVSLGQVAVALGLLSAFGAVLIGLTQRNPKVVLAYSTVSQMGLLTTLIGSALLFPRSWPLLSAAVVVFAVHHGVAKAALFLAAGAATRLRLWLMLLPALALAGAPFTSGAFAKAAAKGALDVDAGLWGMLAANGLTISSVMTALLMLHLLGLVRLAREPGLASRSGRSDAGRAGDPDVAQGARRDSPLRMLPVLVLIAAAAIGLPAFNGTPIDAAGFSPVALWDALWPLLVAVAIAVLAWLARINRYAFRIPEGDLIVPVERGLARVAAVEWPRFPHLRSWRATCARLPLRRVAAIDRHLRLAAAGTLLLLGALLLAWLTLL